jgi:hypothetical protein
MSQLSCKTFQRSSTRVEMAQLLPPMRVLSKDGALRLCSRRGRASRLKLSEGTSVFLYFEDNPLATILGLLAFVLVCVVIYRIRRRRHK